MSKQVIVVYSVYLVKSHINFDLSKLNQLIIWMEKNFDVGYMVYYIFNKLLEKE